MCEPLRKLIKTSDDAWVEAQIWVLSLTDEEMEKCDWAARGLIAKKLSEIEKDRTHDHFPKLIAILLTYLNTQIKNLFAE